MGTDDYVNSLENRISRLEKFIVIILITCLSMLGTLVVDLIYTYRSHGIEVPEQILNALGKNVA